MTLNLKSSSISTPLSDPSSTQSQELTSLRAERSAVQSRINDLESKQAFWHSWYMRSAAATGGLALLIGLIGVFVISAQQFESNSSSQVSFLRKRIESIDAQRSGMERADSQLAIAQAVGLAWAAEGHTQKLQRENIELSAALAHEAAEAQERAQELRLRNLAIEGRVTEANEKLEAERKTRLELEASLAPRSPLPLEFRTAHGRLLTNFDQLKAFTGQEAWIEYVPEYEARRAARSIEVILKAAQWRVTKFSVSEHDLQDGVEIWRWFDHNNPQESLDSRQKHASCALAEFLHGYKWDVAENKTGTPARLGATEPTEALTIYVGLKPTPYFNTPDWKEAKANTGLVESEAKEVIAKVDKFLGVAPRLPCSE